MNNNSKDPAFLFYSSDFLTGCAGLTMEERGQYITLICLQHQQGHLSEKTIRLSLGLPFGNLSEDVKSKFKTDANGLFYNKRVDEEKEKRRKFTDSRRNNGQKGGRPKKPLGYPLGYPTENLPENENEIKNKNDNETDFIIPTIEEIKNYCVNNNSNINAELFYNFYSSKGWYVGKNKMKDWKAAVRTWVQKENLENNMTVNIQKSNEDTDFYKSISS